MGGENSKYDKVGVLEVREILTTFIIFTSGKTKNVFYSHTKFLTTSKLGRSNFANSACRLQTVRNLPRTFCSEEILLGESAGTLPSLRMVTQKFRELFVTKTFFEEYQPGG